MSSSGKRKKKKKKKKKKGLSKKQLEKKKREEEERKRKEEEERKRIEEEERIKREEEERKRKEEETKRRKTELDRLNVAHKEFRKVPNALTKARNKVDEKLREDEEWADYLSCSSLPQPSNQSEINSYLSLWRENFSNMVSDKSKRRDLKNDFKECEEAMKLFYHIEEYMFTKLTRELHKDQMNESINNMIKVSHSILDTIDDITAYIMQFSDIYVTEGKNYQYFTQTESIKYCLWINILKNPRIKNMEFNDIKASVQLVLKGAHMLDYGIRIIHFKNDPLSITSTTHPIFVPVGGVIYVDFLNMPPAPIVKHGWTIRKLTDLSKKIERKLYKEVDIHKKLIDPPPTRVSFTIPENVIIRKDVPRIAWWDGSTKSWSQEGIQYDSVKYDHKLRRVTFNTTHLTTALAVVQERVFDVPFQRWFLTPLPEIGTNVGLFSVSPKYHHSEFASVQDVVMLIVGNKVKLMSPKRDELKPLNETFLNPKVLLQRLSDCGINLVLIDEDKDNCERVPKSKDLEDKVYLEMSHLAACTTFTSSKFNHDFKITPNEAMFRISPEIMYAKKTGIINVNKNPPKHTYKEIVNMLDIDMNEADDWDNIYYDTEKCCFANCNDGDKIISKKPIEGLNTEINLCVALEKKNKDKNDVFKTDPRTIILETDVLYMDTVKDILKAVRPLSWC